MLTYRWQKGHFLCGLILKSAFIYQDISCWLISWPGRRKAPWRPGNPEPTSRRLQREKHRADWFFYAGLKISAITCNEMRSLFWKQNKCIFTFRSNPKAMSVTFFLVSVKAVIKVMVKKKTRVTVWFLKMFRLLSKQPLHFWLRND